MDFEQSPEQAQLVESVTRFVERRYAFGARKAIIASGAPCSDETWTAFADMGLLGLPFAQEHGGFGWGAADMMDVMGVLGAALVVEPYLSTVGLAAQFIARGGSAEQKTQLLPAVAEGRLKMAFAHAEEDARYDLAHVESRARRAADGWLIDGRKCVVLHAPSAGKIVLSARTAGDANDPEGISLFLVEAHAQGLACKPYRTIDGMPAADLELRHVAVPDEAVVGRVGEAGPLIEQVVDFATALLAGEAVGVIRSVNDQTLEYLRSRRQFGVALGSFQALQHRMVDMMISHEQARSMACLACAAVDTEADPARRGRRVSAAKIRIADACRQIRHEAVQLHGGIGMTDELKLSHAFRRLTAISQQFGDTGHHLARFARLDDPAA